MPDSLENLTPLERAKILLERQRTALGKPTVEETTAPVYDDDLIPDLGDAKVSPKMAQEIEADIVIDGIDIIPAYVKYIAKMEPDPGRRSREGVMVSCPMPGHRDSNPSAWVNTDSKLWFCGACQIGGDIYDFKAISMGLPVPDYRNTKEFRQVRLNMAQDFGFTIVKGLKEDVLVAPDPQPVEEPVDSNVIHLPAPIDADPEEWKAALNLAAKTRIEWEDLCKPGTFLRDWMEACTIDDLPHEYYFWLGLQALGFAAGNDILLQDFTPVQSNLFLCLYGPTGVGKSRSMAPYRELLNDVFHFTYDATEDPTGVLQLPTPNSAEALVDSFSYEVMDASTGKTDHMAPVKGLLHVEEFSSFVARAARPGSTMKETYIELYDATNRDVTSKSMGRGINTAKNPFCQMLTSTQPNAIRAFLRKTDTESGFLNRMIWAFGMPRVKPIAYGGKRINVDVPKDHLRNILAWVKSLSGVAGGDPYYYFLEDEALDVYREFFDKELAPFKSGLKDQDSMLARVDLTIKKLIILFTVNEQLTAPNADTVHKAISLYIYLSECAASLGGDINKTEFSEIEKDITEVVTRFQERHKDQYPSRNEINKLLKRRWQSDEIGRAMKVMVEMEVIEEIPPAAGTRGRPAMRYSVAN